MAVKIPYIQVYRSKGKTYTYYRRDGHRIRIPGAVGSTTWMAEYQEANKRFDAQRSGDDKQFRIGSLTHLITGYMKTDDFKSLAKSTKKDYLRYISFLQEKYGDLPVKALRRQHIYAMRNKLKSTPRAGDYLISVLKVILSHAEEHTLEYQLGDEWESPALRVKKLQKKKRNKGNTSPGHRAWEDDDINKFRATWGISSVERFAFELLLATGQRGGDGITMEKGHIKDGQIYVVQDKTNARLWIPMTTRLKELVAYWEGVHPKQEHFLISERSKPFKVDRFRHVMKSAYRKAGLAEDLTTHGLRHTAATIMHEVGCSLDQIRSITGHTSYQMLKAYLQQRKDAKEAIDRLNRSDTR